MVESGERWLFRYVEDSADASSRALGKPSAVRPIVPVSISYMGETTLRVTALVDSGSERVFAAPTIWRELNLDLSNAPETIVGLGGKPRRVRFKAVTLQLYRDIMTSDDQPLTEWEADVGFITDDWEPPWAMLLGRDGFFNKFTITMHGGVPAMVIEQWDAFDKRFGIEIEDAPTRQPRFKP